MHYLHCDFEGKLNNLWDHLSEFIFPEILKRYYNFSESCERGADFILSSGQSFGKTFCMPFCMPFRMPLCSRFLLKVLYTLLQLLAQRLFRRSALFSFLQTFQAGRKDDTGNFIIKLLKYIRFYPKSLTTF